MTHDETLRRRAARCVCKFCGQPLKEKFIIFNKYGGQGTELFCEHCQRIEYGVEPEIYSLAEEFFDNYDFNYYLDMEEDETARELNIAKLSEVLTWTVRKMGLLDENGLKK